MNPNLARYIGIPYVFKGESLAHGVDCYGLCRLFYRAELGIELPDYGCLYTNDGAEISQAVLNNRAAGRWKMTDTPSDFAIATFRVKGLPIHCGIVLPGCQDFLHAFQGRMTTIEGLSDISWRSRVEGYSTWCG